MPDRPDWTGAPVAPFQSAVHQFITVSEAGTVTALLAVPAARSAVVTRIVVSAADFVAATVLRDLLGGVISYGGGPTIIQPVAISPDNPYFDVVVDPASAVVPGGSTIEARLSTRAGSGRQSVYVTLTYYLGD